MAGVRWMGWAAALLLFPCVSFGDRELAAEVAQMAESDLQDACDDDDFLSCLNVKNSACKSAAKSAIETCRSKLPVDVDESELNKNPEAVTAPWSSCVTAKMTAMLKISGAAFNKCNMVDDGSAP